MRHKKLSQIAYAVLFALTALIMPMEVSATPPVPVVLPSEVECVSLKRAARLTINDDPSFTLTVDEEHVGYGYRSPGPFDKEGFLRFTYLSDGTTYQFQDWDSLKCHAITHYDASLSVSGSPVPTSTPTPKPIVTINRYMHVREGPGTNYPVIGTVAPGRKYVITGRNSVGDWWRIDYNGLFGWVYGPLVKASADASSVRQVPSPQLPTPTSTLKPTPTRTPRPTRTPTPTPTPKPIVTINRHMNVREGPGTNYPVIGTVAPGQKYAITGRNSVGDWWRINYNGLRGWVYGPFVKASANASSVRRVPSPRLPTPTFTPTPERIFQISYEDLFRNAERYRGQLVYYRGEVIQALEDRCIRWLFGLCLEEGNVLNYQLRVNVTPSGWLWVDTVFLRYDNAPARIIEGDIISFVAQVNGVITYESIMGASVTIPDLTVVRLDVE